jgi:ABC-type branched-subunit amino acid transport system substrate-binding protein
LTVARSAEQPIRPTGHVKRAVPVLMMIAALLVATLSAASCTGALDAGGVHTAKIGVLLPLTGERPLEWERVLDWEVSGINAGLKDARLKIELVYRDTFGVDVSEISRQLIADKSMDIAIGPMTSREAMRIAPQFAKAGKLLISPCATADELFRAFAGDRCFVRTCQSDVGQASTILSILKSQGTKRLSLIYEGTTYGRTFQSWMGFFTREMGVDLVSSASFSPGQADMSGTVSQALEGGPQCVVLAAFPDDAAKILQQIDRRKNKPRVFSTDAAMQPSLIKMLGEKAEGLEGVTPAEDPASGFTRQYKEKFGHAPEAWAAETYDALLLAAVVSARQRFLGDRSSVYDAFFDVVAGTGSPQGCTIGGITNEIKKLLKGGLPKIMGATGRLAYDRRYGVDTVDAFYAHWQVADGAMRLERVIPSSETMPAGIIEPSAPEASALPSPLYMNFQPSMRTGPAATTIRRDLWAVIAATSSGLDNYRHQADALGMYWLLRSNGVSDDRIILMMADDIRDDAGNIDRGEIRNQVGGRDLREGAKIDYSGDSVTARNFENVMTGYSEDGSRPALETSVESDVLVYVAGDGENGDIRFAKSRPLTAKKTGDLIDKMYETGRFRQLLLLAQVPEGADACSRISSPRAVAIASSSHEEAAVPANYDSDMHVWLADRFTFTFIQAVSRSSKNLSVADTYRRVYLESGGSHVAMLNYENFDVNGTKIADFIRP